MTAKDYNQFEYPKLLSLKDKLQPTRHLNRQVLCGLCRFICCKSKIFIVETTQEESKRLNLPLAFPQSGACPECTPTGCKHAEARPVLCKLYPVGINERGKAGTFHWVLTHCPTPKHYEFVEKTEDGKYKYRKRADLKGPVKNNVQDEFVIDFPLEEHPNILEMNREALVEIFGEERVQKLEKGLDVLNEEDQKIIKKKGFGLVHKDRKDEPGQDTRTQQEAKS